MRALPSALVLACLSMSLAASRPFVAAGAAPTPAVTVSPSSADPADVVALRAKMRAAEGHRPATERVIETITANGTTLRRSIVRVGDDERTSFEDGPFRTASGLFQGQRWFQNRNGLTVLQQNRSGNEARERRSVTLSHVSVPIVADVVSDLDPKGHGTRTYVDATTSRVVRVDDIKANETVVSTFDDFRTTDGFTRPWHTHVTDGIGIDESDVRIDSIATAHVTAAAVAIPPPRRALVTFPAGMTSVSLPVELDGHNHFIVRVNVGGRGLDFVLDTGASGIVIDESVARSLDLTLLRAGSNAAAAGRFVEHGAVVPEMRVGPLIMNDVAVRVAPVSFDDPHLAVRAVGLLGFDFIASLALRFDYANAKVTATEYDAFEPPTGKDVYSIPIRLGGEQPETDVTIDGRLGERFIVDSGGAFGIMMTDVFTRRYPGITNGFTSQGRSVTLNGVGGDFRAAMYLAPHVRLGPVDFDNFSTIVIGSANLYAEDGDDGTVGPDMLSRFTVTTDYADSTIFLERAR